MDQFFEENFSDTEEDTLKGKYLFFRVGDDTFAIEIANVKEIVVYQSITEVPEVPDFVKGVINLRGQIVPVIDVRLRLKMSFKEYHTRTCIIVIHVDNNLLGLIVDSVLEVNVMNDADITVSNIQEQSELESHYVRGIGRVNDEIKIILNVQNVISDAHFVHQSKEL